MIPLFKMNRDISDIDALLDVYDRAEGWACGPEIDKFEKRICDYMGSKYCVVFNSGGSALHALMIAYGIKQEVIVPSFTFIATADCVKYVDARPVFADIEEDTFGLDSKSVLSHINARTQAIICVHYAGAPCDMEALVWLAKEQNLLLFEDNAESMGAEVNGKKVGTFGNAGVLSFCQNKIITTGEGGAVITDDEDIYKKLKLICSYGKEGNDFVSLGYNWRMPSGLAAMGISQLDRIDNLIAMRQQNAEIYDLNLPSEVIPMEVPGHVYQMYSIRCPERDKLKTYLTEKGIGCNDKWFQPVHKFSLYAKDYSWGLKVTEKVSKEILSLPMYPDLKEEEILEVCNAVNEFYRSEHES